MQQDIGVDTFLLLLHIPNPIDIRQVLLVYVYHRAHQYLQTFMLISLHNVVASLLSYIHLLITPTTGGWARREKIGDFCFRCRWR